MDLDTRVTTGDIGRFPPVRLAAGASYIMPIGPQMS